MWTSELLSLKDGFNFDFVQKKKSHYLPKVSEKAQTSDILCIVQYLVRVRFSSTAVMMDSIKGRASLLCSPTNRKHSKSTRVDYNTIVT